MLLRLKNSVKNYDWGDRQRLGELFGLENPQGEPQAEIWMGAHPAAPSLVETRAGDQALDELIAADTVGILGADVAGRFAGKLPYLFKVLNAGQPLSIQLHPDKQTAEAGFAREEAAGIDRNARHRNYSDANHKPELICAITPFRALCGFRPIADICGALALAAVPQLEESVARLQAQGSSAALRELTLHLLQLDEADVKDMLESVLSRAQEIDRPDFNELRLLHEFYPGDSGVMFALLLNLVELQPGEALYLSAGHLHSYLGGVGFEIMASSDNVIRGGLTSKHVDCDELSRLAKFETLPEDQLRVAPRIEGAQRVYPTPAEDFTLSLVEVDSSSVRLSTVSAEILFCEKGEVIIANGEDALTLTRGTSCLVPASVAEYTVSGQGRLARATVALP